MAVRTGTGGSITLVSTSGAVLDGFTIGRWTSVFTRKDADTTPFRVANNHRASTGGNGVLTGTFEGFLDDTTPIDTSDFVSEFTVAAAILLDINRSVAGGASNTIQQVSFNGFLSGVSVNVQPGVPNPVTGSFTSTGAITTQKNTV